MKLFLMQVCLTFAAPYDERLREAPLEEMPLLAREAPPPPREPVFSDEPLSSK